MAILEVMRETAAGTRISDVKVLFKRGFHHMVFVLGLEVHRSAVIILR